MAGSAAALAAAIKTRLNGHANITADVGGAPDVLGADAEGRVWPYAAIYPAGGAADEAARTVDDSTHGALAWAVQVTVAAGDPDWCLQAVDEVRARLEGHVLVVGAGPLREEPLNRPLERDDDPSPARWYVPLLFRCQAA